MTEAYSTKSANRAKASVQTGNESELAEEWYKAKLLYNQGKRDEVVRMIQKLMDPTINAVCSTFRYHDAEELYWDAHWEVINHFASFRPLYIAVKDAKGRYIKIDNDKALKAHLITDDDNRYLLFIEDEINNNLGCEDETFEKVTEIFGDSVKYFRQTGVSFVRNWLKAAKGKKDCDVKGTPRSLRDRQNILKKEEEEARRTGEKVTNEASKAAKKASTVEAIRMSMNMNAPVPLQSFDDTDENDEEHTRQNMPSSLTSASAEEIYLSGGTDDAQAFVDDALDTAEKILHGELNMKFLSPYERQKIKSIYLWEMYKEFARRYGFDLSTLTEKALKKADKFNLRVDI